MPVGLHPIEQIVNVHWEEKDLAFLYSGADGMFGSQTGETWTKTKSSVPATSLAWVDNVWVACGPDGCWRSEDGTRTWSVLAPSFIAVAAMKPKVIDPDDPDEKPKPGIFAGWLEDDAGDNNIIYTSRDLGKTWAVALTIPTTIGATGSESVRSLSGCGGALFVSTRYNSETFHHGDGKIYSSTDGHSFTSQTVFGPGGITLPADFAQFPRIGFVAQGVGYDPRNKQYIAVGGKEIIPEFGVQESYLIYSTSSSPSLGSGDGTVVESARQVTGAGKPGGEFLSGAPSAAGGDGKHVTGFSLFQNSASGSYISGQLKASFIPGTSTVVRAMGAHTGGYIGSFCFRPTGEADGAGTFACVAFDAEKSGGAFIAASGGSFARKHAGTGIGSQGRGAVAVGQIDFSAEPDEP